ncbi:ABC transporter substrate-binding protein [Mixta tenebrionis]|uniref:ABC transporter substrate-binding protein n=2 Tax=Mixta tenebrionis TaxID=2562439 RepID=A0A506V7P3_9GAMM|nr:ABC transporter substrate-binding protein [Mixta tenebrionis]TPW41556.1 ABC transporter substrate-binding protein [Mixta tenebrionis]
MRLTMRKLTPLLFCLSLFSLHVYAGRQVVDQLGRRVTIPDRVDRVVVLQHQTLNLLVQLGATDKIVGVLSNWKQQLGENYQRLAPALASIPAPGDLAHVDPEALVALHPQVVFVTNYAPLSMIEHIQSLGIPVIAISLRSGRPEQLAKLNPVLEDEEQAYDRGLKEGIRLIGNIINRPEQAEELINAAFSQRQLVQARLRAIPAGQRVRVYIANPELTTYGSGKYTGLMMAHAGALNVAAAVNGYKQVSMEQIIAWNPQVILVQNRYPQVINEIKTQPAWRVIDAVQHQRVWLMPEYAKAWGYPMPEATGLGELWLAKKLYPKKFKDIDMQQQADNWYMRFYHTHYDGGN